MSSACLGLVLAALVLIEFLIGGTRLVFSLPSYGLLALAALLGLPASRSRPPNANLVCLLAVTLFSTYVLGRALGSPVEYLARVDLLMVLAMWIVYLLVAFVITTPKQRMLVVAVLLGLTIVHVVLSGIQYCRGDRAAIFSFLQPSDYGLRASGLYFSPNHLAGFLEVSVLLGLGVACWSRRSLWVKIVAGYAALMGLVGLLLTGSRGGYVSMGAGLLTFMILSAITILRTRQERPWVPLGLGMASLLIVAAGMGTFISRHYVLQSRASRLAGHGDPRPYLWQAALRQFRLEPALGTGSGTYLYYGRKFRSSEVKADPEYAHSDYLQFLAEFGVVGAALFMLVFVTHVWSGARFLQGAVRERQGSLGRLPSDSMAMGIGALSVFAACATHAVFDFNMHIPANALLTAFVLGLLASPGIDQPYPEYQFPTVTRWIRWVMPVLGAWILVQGVSTWPAEYFGEQARMAVRDDRYAEAVALARKALRYDSRNPYLSLYLGQANLALAEAALPGQARPYLTAAAEAFRKGITHFKEDTWLLLGMAAAFDGLARGADAETCFRHALYWDPQSVPAHVNYGHFLKRAGRLAEAETQYREAMAIFWTIPTYHAVEELAAKRKAEAAAP